MENQKISTKALHAGHDTNLTQGTRAVPLYQSTSQTTKILVDILNSEKIFIIKLSSLDISFNVDSFRACKS